jgi:hypothetical protein
MSRRMTTRAILLVVAAILAACKGTRGGTGGGGTTSASDAGAILICVHKDVPWSDWDCPDTITQFMAIADMDSVSLVVKTKAGVTHTTPVPRGSDAIFLSQRAVDSILVQYYENTKQGAKADAVRRRLRPTP